MVDSTAHLLTFFESAFDPILLAGDGGKILWQNTAAKRFLGVDAGPGTTTEIFDSDVTRRILATRYYAAFDVNLRMPQGESLAQACVVVNLSSGAPDSLGFLITLKSVIPDSSRVIAREELLATIAHDLKNPLGAIFGYADALLDTVLGAGLSERQREVVSRIQTTALRTLELVRNFQLLEQLQSARIPPPSSSIDLNLITKSVLDATWRPTSSQVELASELHATPLAVRGDKIQLDRVISNLINNAIKFTPGRGRVVVRTWSENQLACLEVRNTGSFIPPEERSQIFKRYARGRSSQGVSGSGLGLYIVKSILDGLGATIEVASSVQDGTSFIVRFPAAR